LEPLLGAVGPDLMRTANRMVDVERKSPPAAVTWIEEQLELPKSK